MPMTPPRVRKMVDYWVKTAAHDYDTMVALFKSKRYSDSLFYGHIVLEKILKAHVVKVTKEEVTKIHDLVRLQDMAKLNLPRETLYFLNKVNDFNIRSRYPEYKLKFYKQCTLEYVGYYQKEIIKLYIQLCRGLK